MSGARPELGWIPDALSGARVLLALALPFAVPVPLVFVALVCAGILTDVLDGRLARRWQTASSRGAVIDLVADVVFYLAFCVSVVLANPLSLFWIVVFSVPVIVIRVVAMMISRRRGGRVASQRTILLIVTGGAVIVAGLAVVLFGLLWPIVLAGGLAIVASADALSRTLRA